MTAAPVSLSLSGRKTDSEGLLTLVMPVMTPLDFVALSSAIGLFSPGGLPGQTLRTSGLSSVRAEDTAARKTRGARAKAMRLISVLLGHRVMVATGMEIV